MSEFRVIKDRHGLYDLVSSVDAPVAESYAVNLHDLERIHPPESDDERAQRHERLAMAHYAEYMRLTGREPASLTWTCVVCNGTHPIDHAGLFCGICKIMVACCSCERTFTGQCHAQPAPSLTAEDVARLRGAFEDWSMALHIGQNVGAALLADAIRTVLGKLEGR